MFNWSFNTYRYLTNTYQYLTDTQMLNQYLTNTYQYLRHYSQFNWSFTNAKLIRIDSWNLINIYQYFYLTVTYQYLVNAYIVKATFNWSWPIFKQ